MEELSRIAKSLGKPDEAQVWEKRAKDLLTKMLARCWEGKGIPNILLERLL